MVESLQLAQIDLLCPMTGELCPRKVEADNLYQDVGISIDRSVLDEVDQLHPIHDPRKRAVALALIDLRAITEECPGIVNESCGIRKVSSEKISWLGRIASKFSRNREQ